ncbi:MAG: glycoside hydrolase family 2 protein [Methyloglobulus sp.]|nr:glycoside hydrolase family 2 protein [Methyloglobulus sp.]
MSRGSGHSGSHPRRFLTSDWQLCATAPAQITELSQLDTLDSWLSVPALAPVADVLRQLKLWSLDAAPRRFDAEDWWYRLCFDCTDITSGGDFVLGFDGLATLAEVWLNGDKLFTSENMFLSHQYPITPRLRTQGNELIIAFRSLDYQLSKRKPRPSWRTPMIENQNLRWVRTTVLGRTPGWSPPAAVVGPWRSIWLERSALSISEIQLFPRVEGNAGVLEIACHIKNPDKRIIEGVQVAVSRNNKIYTTPLNNDGQGNLYTAVLCVDDVDLWWPHTHGEPALYRLKVIIGSAQDNAIEIECGTVGFRTVQLDCQNGAFALRINGELIFCRGACWTPLDPITLDSSIANYASALTQACEAGMNMLRISGTMVYEADAFYDQCDALGIMVWQEFMFASMAYPDDPAFYESVQIEAQQQLSRWQARPSLAVLCGNSEVEQQAAMWGASRDKWTSPLFDTILKEVSNTLCPDVPYWPSSAHYGSFPHQNDVGTTSYYGVGAYLRPLEDARRSNVRFATECLAFANVPEPTIFKHMPGEHGAVRVHHPIWRSRAPRDLGAGWDFEDVRDHYLALLFAVNPMKLRYANHERYLLLSRVSSGEAMAAAFNEWRTKTSNCRGALVWFLRDLWPGAGWGIVDSSGHPKACYYYLKRVLQPIALSMSDEGGNGLYLHLVNEHPKLLSADVEISAYQSGQVLVASTSRTIILEPRGTCSEAILAWFDGFFDFSYAYRFGPAMADVIHAKLKSENGGVIAESFFFPTGLSAFPVTNIGLTAKASILSDGNVQVTVSCNQLALAVHFDVNGFVPDEAYFHLAPGSQKTVLLKAIDSNSASFYGYVSAINASEMASIIIA